MNRAGGVARFGMEWSTEEKGEWMFGGLVYVGLRSKKQQIPAFGRNDGEFSLGGEFDKMSGAYAI